MKKDIIGEKLINNFSKNNNRENERRIKRMKKFLAVLAILGVVGFSGLKANAEGIGVVDLDKVVSNYSKAQDVSTDLKVKEAELQKFLADAQKRLKDTASPIEKKNLEDRLTAEFKTKTDTFKDQQIKAWKDIEDNVFNAIDKTAQANKMTLILNKASVLSGGQEITDQVLNALNTAAAKK